jgi:hypothetical protein
MAVERRPAVPVFSRRVPGFRTDWDRLVGWFAAAVTALIALVAILAVGLASMALGLT